MNDGTEIEPEPDAGQPLSEEVGPETGQLQDYAKLKHAVAREWLPTQALRNPRRSEDQVTERR